MPEAVPRPRVLLLTRHPGALQWLRQTLNDPAAEHVEHLTALESLGQGDLVAGSLPLHLAAALCDRGVVVLGLDLPQTLAQRRRALSAEEMRLAGARLTRYFVQTSPWPAGLPEEQDPIAYERLHSNTGATGRGE